MQDGTLLHIAQDTIVYLHQLFKLEIISLTADYEAAAKSFDFNRLDI